MNFKTINIRLRLLLTSGLFLFATSVRADELFQNIRAFDPASIRQWRIEDSVRAMTVRGRDGNSTNQNISESCQLSNPGALNGNPCCRHLVTEQCTLAVSRGLCPSGFRYDVDNECNDYCDDPPRPSPSPSASPSRSPSPSKSPSPSRSPSAIPSTIQINRMVIEIQDSENAHPDYDNYANNSCVVQGGRKIANGRACEFTSCSFRPFQASFTGRMGTSLLRRNFGCNSEQALTLCNWDCVGIDNAIMQYGYIPPPPPPVTRSPAATRSAVVSRSGTPTRSGTPSLTRTPSRSASGTPYPSYSPFPSRTASAPRSSVTPIWNNTAN